MSRAHESKPSPIGRLPVELTTRIMTDAAGISNSDSYVLHSNCLLPHQPLWTILCLCRVSGTWRSIARRTPFLWPTRFRITFPENSKFLDMATDILRLSAPLPITIELMDYTRFSGGLTRNKGLLFKSPTSFTDAIVDAAPRWNEFYSNGEVDGVLRRLHGAKFLRLRTIHLHQISTPMDLSDAPNLTEVVLHYDHMVHIPLPFMQLTDLALHRIPSSGHALEMLARCSSLSRATLDIRSETMSQVDDIVLPTLQFLKICGGPNMTTLEQAFARLSLPNLQELIIEGNRYGRGGLRYGEEFCRFIGRSSGLTKLELASYRFFSEHMLRHTPHLTELSLSYPDHAVHDDFFVELSHATMVVPKLKKLHMRTIGIAFTANALQQMLAARWWAGSQSVLQGRTRLETVVIRRGISQDWPPDDPIVMQFRGAFEQAVARFKAEGMDLRLDFPDADDDC